jgi:hypothetical protein
LLGWIPVWISLLQSCRIGRVRSGARVEVSAGRRRRAGRRPMAELVGPRVYSCCNCRNHVCLHDDIISKAFQVHLPHTSRWAVCSCRSRHLSDCLLIYPSEESNPADITVIFFLFCFVVDLMGLWLSASAFCFISFLIVLLPLQFWTEVK